MEKPGTINVVGEDKALETSRAIIQTHKYVIENVAILTDRERGYMFNEYFPAVKDYLIIEPDVLLPYMEPAKKKTELLTNSFKFHKTGIQPDNVFLSTIPSLIVGVRVAKDFEAYNRGHSWDLIPVQGYTVNKTTGEIGFMCDVNTPEIMKFLDVTDSFYIFVDYKGAEAPPYEVGTDGET